MKTNNDPKQKRGIRFPMYSLEEAEKVAKAVYESGGGSIDPDSLALALEQSPTASSFITRISSAIHFGLIKRDEGQLVLTELSERILKLNDKQSVTLINDVLGYEKLSWIKNFKKGKPTRDGGIDFTATICVDKNYAIEYDGFGKFFKVYGQLNSIGTFDNKTTSRLGFSKLKSK